MNPGFTSTQKKKVDLAIIGAGMAGMSSALWSARLGMSCLIIEKNSQTGGQLHSITGTIPDYPGIQTTGLDLADRLEKQIHSLGIQILLGKEVTEIIPAADSAFPLFQIKIKESGGAESEIESGGIILATGLQKRRHPAHLDSDRFLYSAGRHLHLFINKRIVIAGGGDGAVENAVRIADRAASVIVLTRSSLRSRDDLKEEAFARRNIQFLTGTADSVTETADGLKIRTGNEIIAADYFLVKIGFEPVVPGVIRTPAGEIRKDEGGYIITDTGMNAAPGIWAVGDVCNPVDPSLSVCAGNACIAVRNAGRSKTLALQKRI